jgi:hypothetical protein
MAVVGRGSLLLGKNGVCSSTAAQVDEGWRFGYTWYYWKERMCEHVLLILVNIC